MNSSNFEQPIAHWRLGTTRLNSILSIILTSPRDNNPHFLLSTRIWPYLRVSRILNWRCSNIYSSKIRLICSADFLLCILALKAISLTTSNQLWKFYHVLYVRPLKNFGSWMNAPTRGNWTAHVLYKGLLMWRHMLHVRVKLLYGCFSVLIVIFYRCLKIVWNYRSI